ncbi:hypothetical protein E1293_37465 [Actinomadura darangshiensis]|uniref:DUF6801 domain-containing protein n=1 Tax=Actinomadura darangshiensis TaxID=705336 RepID=A0A4V2YRV8_9ACTN|nr:DUF6801 domain-containing protein [Actinomadura darangshiensis]TDD67917.1 hypothetical protein E1293_37465 [Actinomadura darangshiensis]
MRTKKTTGGACAALAVAGAMVAASLAGVAGAPPAAAAPATLGLDYHCTFPLLGPQPVHVELSTDVPDHVAVGEVMPGFTVDSVSTVNAESARGLTALYATSLEGHALADATLTVPEMPDGLPVEVDSVLEKTPIPASGGFTVKGRGTSPDLTFTQAGPGKVTVGNLVLKLTPRTDDGGESGLGTFESECTQDPGQNNVLASFDIVGETGQPAEYTYALTGSSTIKASGGTIPLTGALDAKLDAGTVTAALTLEPSKAQFQLLGFLPVTADVAFTAQGGTTGTYKDGVLTTTTKVATGFPAFNAFGAIPIGGGDTCRTSEPSSITLTSAAGFDRDAGGELKGAYELASVTGCGVLTGVLGDALTGPDNAITVALTPKKTS